MRVVQNSQMQIGEVDISQIKFDLKSRDDVPKILKGLQHLYMNLAWNPILGCGANAGVGRDRNSGDCSGRDAVGKQLGQGPAALVLP